MGGPAGVGAARRVIDTSLDAVSGPKESAVEGDLFGDFGRRGGRRSGVINLPLALTTGRMCN